MSRKEGRISNCIGYCEWIGDLRLINSGPYTQSICRVALPRHRQVFASIVKDDDILQEQQNSKKRRGK